MTATTSNMSTVRRSKVIAVFSRRTKNLRTKIPQNGLDEKERLPGSLTHRCRKVKSIPG